MVIRFKGSPQTLFCLLLVVMFALHPVVAAGAMRPMVDSTGAVEMDSGGIVSTTETGANVGLLHPAELMSAFSNHLVTLKAEASLLAARAELTLQMTALDYEPAEAAALVAQLTPADLDVLLANSKMMQRAGAVPTQMLLGIIIVVGVIVALSIAGSGSLHVN